MSVRNVQLTEHYDQFVEGLVKAGKYEDASDVLQAGLRLLEQHSEAEQRKLALLRKLADDGFADLDQGAGLAFDSPDQLADAIAAIGRQTRRETAE